MDKKMDKVKTYILSFYQHLLDAYEQSDKRILFFGSGLSLLLLFYGLYPVEWQDEAARLDKVTLQRDELRTSDAGRKLGEGQVQEIKEKKFTKTTTEAVTGYALALGKRVLKDPFRKEHLTYLESIEKQKRDGTAKASISTERKEGDVTRFPTEYNDRGQLENIRPLEQTRETIEVLGYIEMQGDRRVILSYQGEQVVLGEDEEGAGLIILAMQPSAVRVMRKSTGEVLQLEMGKTVIHPQRRT